MDDQRTDVSNAVPEDLSRSPFSRPLFHGNYECWTNEVSPTCDENVYRENKLKYKNVHLGPIMNDSDVDALLRRKPNAVKNFINSLNEQMRHKRTVCGDVDSFGHSQLRTGAYEPEFGKELQKCNVSVKNRITIFDKKATRLDHGARVIPLIQPSENNYDSSGYVDSSSMRHNNISESDKCKGRLRQCTEALKSQNNAIVGHNDNSLTSYNYQDSQSDKCYSPVGKHRCDEEPRELELPELLHLSNKISTTVDRNYTDIIQGRYTGLSTSECRLVRCNSDLSHNSSARDSFGPIHKEWARNIMSNTSQHDGSPPFVNNCHSSPFGSSTTGETHASLDTPVRSPSGMSARTHEASVSQKVELPLDVICRDLSVHPEYSGSDTCNQAKAPNSDLFTVKSGNQEIILRSVNVIKAGWTWMHSSRARRWFPKYLVLFYDDTKRHSPYQLHAAVRRHNENFTDAGKASPSFWDIYKIYSHLGGAGHVVHRPLASDSSSTSRSNSSTPFALRNHLTNYNMAQLPNYNMWHGAEKGSPSTPSTSMHCFPYYSLSAVAKSLVKDSTDTVVIIPDGASVYLTILPGETEDILGTIKRGEFQELMEVDVSIAPYTKQHAPNNWLAGLISRSMGRDPLNLIHIPLENGYECNFMPLCAVHFAGIPLSFQMECARLKRVGREYEQWIFALWEFVLRSGGGNDPAAPLKDTAVTRNQSTSIPFVRRLRTFFARLLPFWSDAKGGNDHIQHDSTPEEDSTSEECTGESEDHTSLRRVLMCGQSMEGEIGSPEHQAALTRGFAQWIESHGFDDLSVRMNIYTLTNRVGDRLGDH